MKCDRYPSSVFYYGNWAQIQADNIAIFDVAVLGQNGNVILKNPTGVLYRNRYPFPESTGVVVKLRTWSMVPRSWEGDVNDVLNLAPGQNYLLRYSIIEGNPVEVQGTYLKSIVLGKNVEGGEVFDISLFFST